MSLDSWASIPNSQQQKKQTKSMPSKRPSDGWTDQLIDQWAIHGSTKWLIESHKMPLTLLKNVPVHKEQDKVNLQTLI